MVPSTLLLSVKVSPPRENPTTILEGAEGSIELDAALFIADLRRMDAGTNAYSVQRIQESLSAASFFEMIQRVHRAGQ